MATSNSTNFNQTRDDIISDSYVLIGVYDKSDTISSSDITLASNLLNKMLKAWEGQGIHLWTYQEGVIFLTENKQSYSISSSSLDIAGDDAVITNLLSDGSGTLLSVTSTSGMNVSDNIGIQLDDNTLQWTTILSIPDSTSLTLSASLTSNASSGNSIFVFTNRIDRPLDITSARYRYSSGTERPITKKGRDDYMRIPNKDSTGPANQYYYSPKVSSATFYSWPTCSDVGDCIKISYIRRIQDLDSSSDNPDLPQEWLETITFNLSRRLAPAKGIALEKLDPDLLKLAESSLQEMQLWDSEEGSLKIVPNYRYDY